MRVAIGVARYSLSFLCVALFAALPAISSPSLTLEDRVRAQEAIERVYYSHQRGVRTPFEDAVPRELLERKVRFYLQQSMAVERFWQTAVTAEMLEGELQRIARETRLPDRLVQIYEALGNDALVIQECFARPVLVNRLARSFFADDERIHKPPPHPKTGWDSWWGRTRQRFSAEDVLSHHCPGRS